MSLKILQYLTIKYYIKLDDPDTGLQIFRPIYFNSNTEALKSVRSVDALINNIFDEFIDDMETVSRQGSGSFGGIVKLEIKISRSKNIYGGEWVDLPEKIKYKQACVNIENVLYTKKGVKYYDNKCFLWSLLAYKHYNDIKKVEVRYYKKLVDSIKIPENAVFPVSLDDIPLWEKENNIKINVFSLINIDGDIDKDYDVKIEYDSYEKNDNLVNLLLYNNHYVWLKDFDRFDFCHTSKHPKYRCMQCFRKSFPTREKLFEHSKGCVLTKNENSSRRFAHKR